MEGKTFLWGRRGWGGGESGWIEEIEEQSIEENRFGELSAQHKEDRSPSCPPITTLAVTILALS